MAQVYDMRRLHMGCGESLRHHLPLPIYGKCYLPASARIGVGRHAGETIGNKKRRPEGNR